LGLLNRFENELNSRIQDTAEEPIIIFAIGTNDASLVKNKEKVTLIDYEKNLTELIKLSKKYTTKIVIVGLFPVDENLVNPVNWDNAASYLNTSLEAYNSSALKISRAYNLVFINLWEEVSKLDYSKLLYDGLHPNSQGHELIYNKVKKHLLTEQFLRIDL
jgi:lysophospholipase L1-like esterase